MFSLLFFSVSKQKSLNSHTYNNKNTSHEKTAYTIACLTPAYGLGTE